VSFEQKNATKTGGSIT